MYYNLSYLIYMLPALIFSLWASARVKSTFSKYSKERIRCGMTGREAAENVLRANGVYGVRIERISGNLTDHYDPRTNVIRLSDNVYDAPTAAAVGVAAHEAGHAVQHAENYAPIKLRNAIIPITNIGSKLAIPLVLIGLVLSYYSEQLLAVAYAGIIGFSLCVLFQILTLSSEFDASRRAGKALEECGRMSNDEVKGSKKVLSAAAMTYVAALATAIMQLLRLLSIVSSRRRR